MPQVFTQRRDENLDYAIDHSGRLPTGDDIETSTWTVPDGLDDSDDAISGQSVTIFLTGGTSGTEYTIWNQSTTEAGRIVEDFIILKVQ